MSKISDIQCYKVLNSRGEWTLRTQVTLNDGSVGVETIPEGASKGEHEALYLPVEKAVENVSGTINDLLRGVNPEDQEKIDKAMLDLDATENKSNLGGNSLISVSLAVAKAAAVHKNLPLYKYLAKIYGQKDPIKFPTPVFNVLNGGKHAHNGLSFQEFMVIPSKSVVYDKALEMGVNVYHKLKKNLSDSGLDVDVGDEGGFAPNGLNPKKALDFIKRSTGELYKTGEEVFFGMDVAAESFWENSDYHIKEEQLHLSSKQLTTYYRDLMKDYELIYIEDPFYENDEDGWKAFNSEFKNRLMVVADDLAVTNPVKLRSVISSDLANAVIVKPNQVGTLSETLAFIKEARSAGMSVIISHRSGDTAEDTFIADLAVGVNADFIKSGAPARGERVAKYNRLLEIFHEQNIIKG
ncbi:MAG: Enolase [candidate division WWE3 bacterium GW2011_GWA1_41_8]|uniref:Enolase n=2 Tax=Katanobacteria TaxID=422282 RepID=A0A0G0ZKS8_UNCKA|nr:MAG: Enolase [candidate division WWE3 bacterium GW2011_GWA1_41_8]OGC57352.1 MAG: phosphopyruvate hydratase [candidate division WWE3 bacterium RIFCSPLOWO2_01_FULL_41_9]